MAGPVKAAIIRSRPCWRRPRQRLSRDEGIWRPPCGLETFRPSAGGPDLTLGLAHRSGVARAPRLGHRGLRCRLGDGAERRKRPKRRNRAGRRSGRGGRGGRGPAWASRANARMIESGSQFAVGWRAPTSASRPSAVGRWLGSLARHRSISRRTSVGTWSRLGGAVDHAVQRHGRGRGAERPCT
jgi:hypothetical protein